MTIIIRVLVDNGEDVRIMNEMSMSIERRGIRMH